MIHWLLSFTNTSMLARRPSLINTQLPHLAGQYFMRVLISGINLTNKSIDLRRLGWCRVILKSTFKLYGYISPPVFERVGVILGRHFQLYNVKYC